MVRQQLTLHDTGPFQSRVSAGSSSHSPGALMIFFVLGVWIFLRTLCGDAANVSFENVALRQQLAVLQRSVPRPRVYRRGRLFLGFLSTPLSGWRVRLLVG